LGGGLGGLGPNKPVAPAKPKDEQTAEEEGAEEMTEALREFKAASKRENDRFAQATSPEFWFGVYFETKEQRDEFPGFLKALDLLEDQWVNGRKLAEKLGRFLKSPRLPRRSFVSVRSRDVWLDGLCRRIDRASGALWSVPPH
jgi:hypothetical protein